MPEIPELKVITKSNLENDTSLEEIIKERRLLKTKIKLLHIISFDKDLKSLNHVFLNGSQIPTEKETKLNHRMKITLGDEVLIFCLLDVNG